MVSASGRKPASLQCASGCLLQVQVDTKATIRPNGLTSFVDECLGEVVLEVVPEVGDLVAIEKDEYMSRLLQLFPRSRRSTPCRRKVWGEMFGGLLRDAREERGRSVEDAAQAAGMEVAEWEAVEAGQVPENWEQVRRMADGLGIDRSWLTPLVLFCHEAWG